MPENILFSTIIPVRITDLNYGGHVGNDRILGLVHEARMQFLQSHGYSEMNAGGCGLIMRDAVLDFRKELFYADAISIELAADPPGKFGFDLYYQLSRYQADKKEIAALVKTGMITYSYALKKIVPMPDALHNILIKYHAPGH